VPGNQYGSAWFGVSTLLRARDISQVHWSEIDVDLYIQVLSRMPALACLEGGVAGEMVG